MNEEDKNQKSKESAVDLAGMFGVGGILGGVSDILSKLSDLAEKGEQLQAAQGGKPPSKQMTGSYGFSVSHKFHCTRRCKRNGQATGSDGDSHARNRTLRNKKQVNTMTSWNDTDLALQDAVSHSADSLQAAANSLAGALTDCVRTTDQFLANPINRGNAGRLRISGITLGLFLLILTATLILNVAMVSSGASNQQLLIGNAGIMILHLLTGIKTKLVL